MTEYAITNGYIYYPRPYDWLVELGINWRVIHSDAFNLILVIDITEEDLVALTLTFPKLKINKHITLEQEQSRL